MKRRGREKVRRIAPLERIRPGRRFEIEVERGSPWVVELRIVENRRRMREMVARHAAGDPTLFSAAGFVRTWRRGWGDRSRGQLVHGNVLALMFLREDSLRSMPNELVAHEAAHVGMAFARFLGVDPRSKEHEERIVTAIGGIAAQANARAYYHGVWDT